MSKRVLGTEGLHPLGTSEPEEGLGSQRGCGLLKDACRGLSQGSRQPGTAGGHRLVFPGGSAGKGSACNAGDPGSFPGLGRSPGEGKGYPLQSSGLENSMDCIVLGVSQELDLTERISLSPVYLTLERKRGGQV